MAPQETGREWKRNPGLVGLNGHFYKIFNFRFFS
jgi:hypothetical protein